MPPYAHTGNNVDTAWAMDRCTTASSSHMFSLVHERCPGVLMGKEGTQKKVYRVKGVKNK